MAALVQDPLKYSPAEQVVVHPMHAVCAMLDWYVPAAHVLHAVWLPPTSWYVPALHAGHVGVVVEVHAPVKY